MTKFVEHTILLIEQTREVVKSTRKGYIKMSQVEISNRAIEICSMYDKLDKTAQDAIYMAGKLLLAHEETQRETSIRNMLEKV